MARSRLPTICSTTSYLTHRSEMAVLVQRGRSVLRSRAYLVVMRVLGVVLLMFAVLFLWEGLGRLGVR